MDNLHMRSFSKAQYYAFRNVERTAESESSHVDVSMLRSVLRKYKQERHSVVRPEALTELCKRTLTSEDVMTERQKRIERLKGKGSGEVYYAFWARDCDLCESAYAYSFANEFEAGEYIDAFFDGAEGPSTCTKISKDEFDRYEGWSRDLAAEAAGY